MLRKVKNCQVRVYFLCGTAADANKIFQDAKDLQMTGEGQVWIVTEKALAARNVPFRTLGLRLRHANDERKHIRDSFAHIGPGIAGIPWLGKCNTSTIQLRDKDGFLEPFIAYVLAHETIIKQ